jgi:hypothetical protein
MSGETPMVVVPNVVGLTLDQTASVLTRSNLGLGINTAEKSGHARVIRQTPPAGDEVSINQVVSVTLAMSPAIPPSGARPDTSADGNGVVAAWRGSPLGQAMIAAQQPQVPVFTTTEITVSVVQDSIHPIETLAPAAPLSAATRIGDPGIRIAPSVSVKLIANDCLVDSLGPAKQLVVPGTRAEWRFRITPQRHGDMPITAQVTDIFDGPPFAIPVTDLTIHVTSRPLAEVWHVVDEHRAELLPLFGAGGIGTLLVGWFIGRKKSRRSDSLKDLGEPLDG